MNTIAQWKEQLEKNHKHYQRTVNDKATEHEFVATMFNITTDSKDMDRYFVSIIMEVLTTVVNGTTFKYQKVSEENNKNYLMAVNMGSVPKLLDWGGSIRGAWIHIAEPWEIYGFSDDNNEWHTIDNEEDFISLYHALIAFLTNATE